MRMPSFTHSFLCYTNIYVYALYLFMPQAAIPDINVAIMNNRNMVLRGQSENLPDLIVKGILNMNGCLDDELKITFVPKAQYDRMSLTRRYIQCPECDSNTYIEMNKDTTKRKYSKLRKTYRDILKIPHYVDYIKCVNCEAFLYFNTDKRIIIKNIPFNKFDLKELILPSPPNLNGVVDSVFNSQIMEEWQKLVVPVMEDCCRRFRNMYAVQSDKDTVEVSDTQNESNQQTVGDQ